MGEWQRGTLSGQPVVWLISMQNGGTSIGSDAPPSVQALEAWTQELNFEADQLLLDPEWHVIRRYWDANPDIGDTSQAVTAIIDKGMKIRRVGGTYDTDHAVNLQLLQELLAE